MILYVCSHCGTFTVDDEAAYNNPGHAGHNVIGIEGPFSLPGDAP
jgi:hypothetical protein